MVTKWTAWTDNVNPFIIGVAPGSDGFGPSVIAALCSHGISQQLTALGIRHEFVVSTDHPAFNAELYADLPGVQIHTCPHGIRLAKKEGGVDPAGTAERLSRYVDEVTECYRTCGALNGVNLLISVGAPHRIYAASWMSIPTVEVFDHAWGATLPAILLPAGCYDPQTAAVVSIIADFERHADRIYLFPPFLTPAPFLHHWRAAAPGRVKQLKGILGPRPSPRAVARGRLPGRAVAPLAVITGGGTGVWDSLVRALFDARQHDRKATFDVLVPHPQDQATFALLTAEGELFSIPRQAYPSLRQLLAAADLVVSRAGGGIVIDSTAACTPLVALPERGHPQVEAIRGALLRQGLALRLDLATFDVPLAARDDTWAPEAAQELLEALAELCRKPEILGEVAHRMEAIPVGQEEWVAQDIIKRFISPSADVVQAPEAAVAMP